MCPLLEFECNQHGRFEKILLAHVEKLACPKCGKKSEQVISRSTVQFKGSGFFCNDYGQTTKQ